MTGVARKEDTFSQGEVLSHSLSDLICRPESNMISSLLESIFEIELTTSPIFYIRACMEL